MAKTRTITISVNEESDRRFRRFALHKYGKRKGVLGKALSLAMDRLVEEDEATDLTAKSLALMEKGIAMKKWKFNREELYER